MDFYFVLYADLKAVLVLNLNEIGAFYKLNRPNGGAAAVYGNGVEI